MLFAQVACGDASPGVIFITPSLPNFWPRASVTSLRAKVHVPLPLLIWLQSEHWTKALWALRSLVKKDSTVALCKISATQCDHYVEDFRFNIHL